MLKDIKINIYVYDNYCTICGTIKNYNVYLRHFLNVNYEYDHRDVRL